MALSGDAQLIIRSFFWIVWPSFRPVKNNNASRDLHMNDRDGTLIISLVLLAGVYKEMSSILADLQRPRIWAHMRWEEGVAGSPPMSTAIHRSLNKLWRSHSIFKTYAPISVLGVAYWSFLTKNEQRQKGFLSSTCLFFGCSLISGIEPLDTWGPLLTWIRLNGGLVHT